MTREQFVNAFFPFLRPVAGMIYDEIQNVRPLSGKNTSVSDAKGGGRAVDAKFNPVPASAADSYPWRPSASLWLGTGDDPHAGDRAKRFALSWGTVNGQTPSNMNAEFVAFGDITDTGITSDDAVVTFAYWKASVYETDTGQGGFVLDQPTIMTIEGDMGDSLTDLISPPNFGTDGSVPSYIIGQICVIRNYGGALQFVPGLNAYLTVLPVVTGALNGTVTRRFQYTT